MAMFGPTSDHGEIRRWAAVNGAVPVEIAPLLHDGVPTRIGFLFTKGLKSAPELRPISWDGFFALFDLMDLAFVYDEAHPDGYELLESGTKTSMGFAIGPA